MFGGSSSTEYEDIVNKATDENLTSENWELILNLCDKVQDEKQPGAHAAIAAILKRLAHRNPNVQLYALSLTESLGKNLGIEIHRELASRAFTQGLEKLITDRNTHEKVRRRALGLIAMWTAEFENDETLGIMEDCYNNLKTKNYKFEQPQEAPPPSVDDEIRRKEEEELQRVLEMSKQDKGGRSQWSDYSLAAGSSGPSGSSSSTAARSTTTANQAASSSSTAHPFAAPKYSGGGYVPARTPSPNTVAAQQRQQQQQYQEQLNKHNTTISPAAAETVTPAAVVTTPAVATPAASSENLSGPPMPPNMNIVTRVRALHTFEPTEPGELAFEKGDIIKVVDRGYKDWWRGQLKGRTGIFPVNYVEAMPEPTASELAKEAEREAAVFAQAVNVEKLLNMLRAMDPAKDNLADNEEIQELYRSSMALRPKIVKLIDKYSQKRADLVSMNETFVRARTIFDRMMEESLARHSGVYEQPTFRVPQYGQGRPDSRGAAGRRPEYQPAGPQQGYGWNAPPAAAVHEQPAYAQYATPGASPYTSPGAGPGQQPSLQQVGGYGEPATPYGGVPGQQQQQPQQQQVPAGYGVVPQGGYAGHQPGAPYSQQGPTPYPVQGQQPQLQQQQLPVQQQPQSLQQQQPIQQPQQQPLQQPMQAQPVQQQPQQPIQQQPIQQQPIQQQPIQQQPIQQPIQAQPVQQQQPLHQPVQAQPVQQLPVQQLSTQPQQQQPVQLHQEPAYATASSPQPQPQSQPQVQPQAQPQPQPEPQPQPQAHAAPQQPISGPPPYVYNASYTYADPNVQAWAQYYSQGGTDLAGSVYFISIPGVTDTQDNATLAAKSPDEQQQLQQQYQHQPQHQEQQQQQQQQQPQQTLGRQTSLQAQASYQARPADSEPAYGAAAASSVRATSPAQQQQQPPPQTTGFQLHDQPAYGAYQQPALGQGPAADVNAAQPQASSPTRGTISAVRQNSAGSPTQSASTPSWVLPKKTVPVTQGLAGDASYFPPTAGLGGLTLTDPGSGSAVSG